ncbi:MAG: hydantoinase B/oxoprolinase family protein, partial [Lacipirellulaceae bacterium]
VDAYLNPVLRTYFAKLQKELPGSKIRLMTSAGGLTSIESFRGCQSVLSGPAGGVVGYAQAAEQAGYSKAIGFDRGGTSTDVSRYAGEYEQEFESDKAGVRLMTPTLAIETIAAGGGSVCWFDGVKLRVGPDSAGADPGPACYGRGGPLTVTDVNLALGRVLVHRFPFQLDKMASLNALDAISRQVEAQTGERLTVQDLAEGFLKIANTNMAGAIRNVTIAKGVQPDEHLLVAFGGAAAQHACAVADDLGIREILHHPDAGILSAYGISVAEEVRHSTRGLWQSLAMLDESDLQEIFSGLAESPTQEFAAEGVERDRLEFHPYLEVHYTGSDAKLMIPYKAFDTIRTQFEELHQKQFGYLHRDRPLHIASTRLEVRLPALRLESEIENLRSEISEPSSCEIFFHGRLLEVPVYERKTLATGTRIDGPALIAQEHTLVVVDPTWRAQVLERGELLLSKDSDAGQELHRAESQAVELEIFNNLLVGVAERMGNVLRRTAVSVNVKERLDYSCAVFTGEGKLVANAPHVPVHLGAMGITVRSILADNPNLQPGDVFISNDPYRGGSHLPDITMVLPVYDEVTGELLFCTACRAHHAEIGGVQPGSMPPNSTKLAEEGVLISNFLYRRNGRVFESELRDLFVSARYPSRNPNENLADLAAQAAAVERGANELKQVVREHGKQKLLDQMQAVQRAAEQKVRQSLAGFAAGQYEFKDFIQTASGESVPIKVMVTLHG